MNNENSNNQLKKDLEALGLSLDDCVDTVDCDFENFDRDRRDVGH